MAAEEITQMVTIYPHNGILLSNKKESHIVIHYNKDKITKNYKNSAEENHTDPRTTIIEKYMGVIWERNWDSKDKGWWVV